MKINDKPYNEISLNGRNDIYRCIQKMFDRVDYGSTIRIITTENGIIRMYKYREKTYQKLIKKHNIDLKLAFPITKGNLKYTQYFSDLGAKIRHLPDETIYRIVNIDSKELMSHVTFDDDLELNTENDYGTWTNHPEYVKMAAIFFDTLWNNLEDFINYQIFLQNINNKKMEKKLKIKNKIFIVHGHDQNLRQELEIFLTEIGLEPIVLSNEADEGLTIIEKFEKHSEVDYAFILLTPDDMSYSVLEANFPKSERKIELRARQNVVFEFGYFVGKLGRNRICCISKTGVSLSSNISGIAFKKVRNSIGEIHFPIIKELKTVGLFT